MAEIVYSPSSTGSTEDQNALSMANDISRDLQGTAAPETGGQITKSRIFSKMNDTIDKMAGKAKFKFLKTWTQVNGYEVDTDTAELTSEAAATSDPADLSGDATSYWAEQISTGATYLVSPVSVVIDLTRGNGIGLLNGTMTFYICPSDSDGEPDIANPTFTSTAIVVTDGVTDTGQTIGGSTLVTFTFADVTTVLTKSTAYWYVLKFVAGTGNGEKLWPLKSANASTTTKHRLSDASAWTDFTEGRFEITLTYYQADYISTITLSADMEDIIRIAGTNIASPDPNLRPFSDNRYMLDKDFLPSDRFVVRRVVDGESEILIDSSINNLVYQVEHYKAPNHLADDEDIPDCPKSFRYVIKEGTKYEFLKLGLGQNPNTTKKEAKDNFDNGIEEMIEKYVDHPSGLRVRKSVKISLYPDFPRPQTRRRLRDYWNG